MLLRARERLPKLRPANTAYDGQFDIRTGTNLAWPVDHDMGDPAAIPEPVKRWFKLEQRLQWKTRVHDLHTYEVRVTDGTIEVQI